MGNTDCRPADAHRVKAASITGGGMDGLGDRSSGIARWERDGVNEIGRLAQRPDAEHIADGATD